MIASRTVEWEEDNSMLSLSERSLESNLSFHNSHTNTGNADDIRLIFIVYSWGYQLGDRNHVESHVNSPLLLKEELRKKEFLATTLVTVKFDALPRLYWILTIK
jgi:hypothetical protein